MLNYLTDTAYFSTLQLFVTALILQNGLKPIHYAAQDGKEAVIKLLVEKFHMKPDDTSNV